MSGKDTSVQMFSACVGSLIALALIAGASPAAAAEKHDVLIEADSFADYGGWVLDPQYITRMGSSFPLAHGLGKPVANAKTATKFPSAGTYRLWVRTRDWVPSHHPGRFKVVLDGAELPETFGAKGEGWLWQDGGRVEIRANTASIELKDLTGFEGRCDALLFTSDMEAVPPAKADANMDAWRRRLLGLPADPPSAGTFGCVVVGGGVAGCAAALTAARLGLDVALIQNRPVLGGNASTELGIPPRGEKRSVVEEVAGRNRSAAIEAEKRIKLFLGWHAYGVRKGANRITRVGARHTSEGRELHFAAPVFIDCTGDGWIGYWAGADYRIGRESSEEFKESLAPKEADKVIHGITVEFGTRRAEGPVEFPDVPWAMEVAKANTDLNGHYGWECGQRRDVLGEAEEIRDYAFRAIYGSFRNVKRADPEKNANLELWVRHIVAGNESRRLMGDHILTQGDIQSQGPFDDAVATGGCFFCRHTPDDRRGFGMRFRLTGVKPCPIPFRSLYSRNVENLMPAGRCISATHIGFCSIKPMKTGGHMGVATGAAAYLCVERGATPRQVGKQYIRELQDIVNERGDYAARLRPKAAAR